MKLTESILDDHQEVRSMFEQLEVPTGQARVALFIHLREQLVRHEVAEEQLVRPLTARGGSDGEMIANDRTREESETERLLKQMERTEVGSRNWEEDFALLHHAVLTHAEQEETVEVPRLRSMVSTKELDDQGRRFQLLKDIAATHPHPVTPNTTGANLTLGPPAAVLDRARDAVRQAL